nr:sodium channel protein Nach-like isoform X1 [Onthophagus taurus]
MSLELSKIFGNFGEVLKDYLLNSSFHGLKFLAQTRLHWSEKVFWFICCVLSWYSSILLIEATLDDYQHNSISFGVETNYLDWNTSFPAIFICESDNAKKISSFADKTYGDPRDYNLDEIIKEIVFYKGLSFYTLQICDKSNPACLKENFEEINRLVRSKCEEIVKNCEWNRRKFNCCGDFVKVSTEFGECFAINSLQTEKNDVKMISNHNQGPGEFRFEIHGYANLYILGKEEVPSLTTSQMETIQITPNVKYKRLIALNEIENVKEVKNVDVSQRNCKFLDETDEIDVNLRYSYSVCCVQCRKSAQIKKCGCAHHLVPNTPFDLRCTPAQLKCLSDNYNELSILKSPWSNKTGLICDCLPSCTESDLKIVRDTKKKIDNDYAVVEVSLDRLPSERYKRNVLKDKLGLVVSTGGTAGLFIGASLLCLVELIYYFLIKPFNNYIKNV